MHISNNDDDGGDDGDGGDGDDDGDGDEGGGGDDDGDGDCDDDGDDDDIGADDDDDGSEGEDENDLVAVSHGLACVTPSHRYIILELPLSHRVPLVLYTMHRCGSLATLACDHTRPSKATHKHTSTLERRCTTETVMNEDMTCGDLVCICMHI